MARTTTAVEAKIVAAEIVLLSAQYPLLLFNANSPHTEATRAEDDGGSDRLWKWRQHVRMLNRCPERKIGWRGSIVSFFEAMKGGVY
mmetsp:Transcript_29665/g.60940  ORF Transcript_29665/g.60940 Transcript_29665/m.60940 type:complete len:87 (-) Transcript_29665:106-366(-)